ncbi:MAG TPA: hypothetical protein P5257_07525 [Bacteroidales bacterium]|nr:hypothetical protein [Bacteroidales bacterium]HRT89955.1 hypothetical protein [Bacteroidales bacterium]
MRNNINVFIVILLFLAAVTACRDHYHANVSGIKVDIRAARLENDLFSADPASIPMTAKALAGKYGKFLQYFSYVINIGEVEDSLWKEGLLRFCTDKLNNEVYGAVQNKFDDISDIEKGLTEAFRHYLYYFPGSVVPEIYTCITGFNNSIIVGDSVLGIGLDRYLGKECRYYSMLGLYNYQVVKMSREYIVPDAVYAWIASEWDYASAGYDPDNVLSEIIHEGKLLYLKKCMLPDLKDELIFGFTPEQLSFCKKNEGMMWQYMIENNLLFSSDQLTRKKLTGEAPFTTYFTRESPGRAAVWIGFRIVESYMKNNRGVTPEDLMKERDTQVILSGARYSPGV